VGQPRRNFTKMASWSRASEHLVNPIGMSDQLKWNNQLYHINYFYKPISYQISCFVYVSLYSKNHLVIFKVNNL
ncbi:hypothetical protein, partial [uncultured Catenibacterium sp.]|uniref:hypothetical protein n=1 Tax=uncultured Catenibacterium sp. TaxID=286142 RepID=UPI0025F3005E